MNFSCRSFILSSFFLFLGGCGEKGMLIDGISLDDLQNRGVNGYYVLKTDKPYTGEIVEWHDSNQMKYRTHMEYGFKEGLWVSWYKNGQKKNEGNYWNGIKEGSWTSWYDNGQKRSEKNWNKGKPHGLVVEWYKNGQKREEINFKNGKHNGLWVIWHDNGQMMSKMIFDDGEFLENSGKYWNSKGESVDSSAKAIP